MKFYFTIFSILLASHAFSQAITWSAPVVVTTGTNSNLHPRVALDKNNKPMVLWGNSSSNMAYFARWNGTSFTAPVMANPMSTPVFAADWAGPDMCSHGDTVYIVYKQTPEGDTASHMYIIKSNNGGLSFSAQVKIDNIADSLSRFPIVTTDAAGSPLVGFMKFNSNYRNARYVITRSMDYGNTFMPDVRGSGIDSVCDCCPASVLSAGNNRIMLCRHDQNNIRTMWAGISTDNGNSFNSNVQVDGTNWMVMACPASGPDGVIVGDTLYSAWMSQSSGTALVYKSKASISAGVATATSLISAPITGLAQQNYPRMASAGNAAAIVWKQVVNGTGQVGISFTNSITSGFPTATGIVGTGTIMNADVAMAPGEVHVVWEDDNTNTVMYRKGTYTVAQAGVQELARSAAYIIAFPNPANNTFSISANGIGPIAKCVLIDNSGRMINLKYSVDNDKLTVSVARLPQGLYYVSISDDAGNSYYSRITVQHDLNK